MKTVAVFVVSSLVAVSLVAPTTAFATLIHCKPVKNCRAANKPCFVEVTQRNWSISFIGSDVENNPLRPKAAIRLRMCTGVDDVCKSGSRDQRFNWNVVNQVAGQIVTGGQLSAKTGIFDTGPYTEIGPHTFFGGACLFGRESCKIAWQYCEFELPLASPHVAAPGRVYKKPREIAPYLNTRRGNHVQTHSLFGR